MEASGLASLVCLFALLAAPAPGPDRAAAAPVVTDTPAHGSAAALAWAPSRLSLHASTPAPAAPEPPAWEHIGGDAVRPDRLQHATLAFAAGTGVGLLAQDPLAALATGVGLGLVKEIWDARRSRWEFGDLVADGIGALAAAWFVAALDRSETR